MLAKLIQKLITDGFRVSFQCRPDMHGDIEIRLEKDDYHMIKIIPMWELEESKESCALIFTHCLRSMIDEWLRKEKVNKNENYI